jgi:DNA-binding transcriptional MerR regulator
MQPVATSSNIEPVLLTIGTIAKQAGVTVRTLRYYEELGLIAPAKRTDSKYRLYADGVLRRIKAILSLQNLGYTLEQTLVILGPYADTACLPKTSKVAATKESLQHIAACIDEKLDALLVMKADVHQRLYTLEHNCQPCILEKPATLCDTRCTHRDVHMD